MEKIIVRKIGETKIGTNAATGKPWTLLTFQGESANGELHWYRTFRTSLFNSITPGAELNADIEVKESEMGTIRVIKQLYVNGVPVGGRKAKETPPAQSPPPEQAAVNRASIECQVAIKEVGECLRAKVALPDNIEALYWKWICSRLEAEIGNPTPPAPPPAMPPPPAAPDTPDLKGPWSELVEICHKKDKINALIGRLGTKGLSIPIKNGQPDLSEPPDGITLETINKLLTLVKMVK